MLLRPLGQRLVALRLWLGEIALQEVRLDRRGHNANLLVLLHLGEKRMVGLAVLFVRFQGVGEISGHVILHLLQNTNDLAAQRCMTAETAELARSEPQDSWVGTCLSFPLL